MKDSDSPIPSAILFRYSFIICACVAFPFLIYAWIKGHPFFSVFRFVALLQSICLACVTGLFGGLFCLAARRAWCDYEKDTFGKRFVSYLICGITIAPILLLYFFWKEGVSPKITLQGTLLCMLLWLVGSASIALRHTLWDWIWGDFPEKRGRRLSRKQRERVLREAARIEREDL